MNNKFEKLYPSASFLKTNETEDGHVANFGLKCATVDEFKEWLQHHQQLSGVTYRVQTTTPCTGKQSHLRVSNKGKLLNVTRLFLSFIGIWSEDGTPFLTRIFCMMSLSAYSLVGMISFLCHSQEDVITYGISLNMPIIGLQSIVKTLWCFYNSEKIGWLVNELERITIENISKEKSHRQEFTKAVNIPKVLSVTLIVMMGSIFLMETLNCIFFNNNKHKLMFNLFSFIDPTRYYYLALLFQYFYWIWPTPVFMTTLNLLMSFTMLTVANLSVLETYFRSAPTNLSRSIDLHTDIIRIVRVMNEVLRPVLISELASSSIYTCICAFMLVKSTTMEQKIISYSVMLFVVIITWFICRCGSLLEEKSGSLTDAVYSSRWIELKPKQRKDIIILMIVTNRPLQIKLSWTHIVNFAYYTSFIQMSYSFLTLLLSMDSD